MFSDAREKSCGLKMFMSQGKMPVARQPLAAFACRSLIVFSEEFTNLVGDNELPWV
jgi:hypothetical protein